VVAIDGEDVTLDANHPLAGVDLAFDVEIVAARAATAEELSHGHAHGGDGTGHCQ
jgi:FKBP-type peptidyl-prolyl cis-trans isomerase SlyD